MNSELAGLLELVAAEGADAFYTGPVARKMVEQINQRGGCFTLEDLSRYQPKYRTPVKTTYRGLEVAAFAPPSGGCAVVEMLNILEHSDLAAMGHNTAASHPSHRGGHEAGLCGPKRGSGRSRLRPGGRGAG